MDSFTSQLRASMEKMAGSTPPWGDVNPLVVIGQSEALLDLGLNESQIHASIKSFGRQLASQIHPDRNPTNVSPERQRQILAAFDFLDDPQNFSLAFADFRKLKAEDRRESKILSQSLSSLRGQLTGFESKWNELTSREKQLEVDRRSYEQLKKEDPPLVPSLEIKIDRLSESVKTLTSQLEKEKRFRSEWKLKFEYAAAFIAGLGDPNPKGIIALDAKWVMVASLWHKDYEKASPLGRFGSIRKELIGEAKGIGIEKKQLEKAVEAWKVVEQQFGTPFAFETKKLPMGFSIMKLEGGKETLVSGDRYFGGRRIIGSIFPDKTTITRSQFRHRIPREIVFEMISPLLAPGNLLVPVQTPTRQTVPWSYFCPSFKFNTTALILAVG